MRSNSFGNADAQLSWRRDLALHVAMARAAAEHDATAAPAEMLTYLGTFDPQASEPDIGNAAEEDDLFAAQGNAALSKEQLRGPLHKAAKTKAGATHAERVARL